MIKNFFITLSVVVLLAVIGWFCMFLHHADDLWDCKSTGWQLGRDTKFSFVTGKCAMATGRVDANGDPIMVI